jgi:uncharacterized membrane protein YesL
MSLISGSITERLMPLIATVTNTSDAAMADFGFETMVLSFDMAIRFILALGFTIFLGQGPTTAGITYILRNYAREEHAWLLSDWWQHTKSNFWQAMVVWIIDLIVVVVLATAFRFYAGMGGPMIYLSGIVIVVSIVYVMMHFYIYQLMVTFKNSIRHIFKNALILTLEKSPRNMLMLVVLLVIHIGIPYIGLMKQWTLKAWTIFGAIEILYMIALSGFITNFFVYPQLERYINAEESNDISDDVMEA